MPDTPHQRGAAIKTWAHELGFQLVGIARAEASAYGDAYRAWIAQGKQGEMQYLAREMDLRLDPRKKFPWARSILCLGISYFTDAPEDVAAAPHAVGKVARYAWGRDYHKVVEGKLKKLERQIRAAFSEGAGEALQIRFYADTGPLLERELAARAGLGWVGKNTLLIHPRHGSYFVLGEMVLSLELAPDDPMSNHCGTCTRCIDACPTRAITPYSVDGRACISYLTLEHRGTIGAEFHEPLRQAGYLVGCDICQEVCPFNGADRPMVTDEPDFMARAPAPAVPLAQVLAWQEQEWDILTRGRATRRAKFAMWQRNGRILSGEEVPAEALPPTGTP